MVQTVTNAAGVREALRWDVTASRSGMKLLRTLFAGFAPVMPQELGAALGLNLIQNKYKCTI